MASIELINSGYYSLTWEVSGLNTQLNYRRTFYWNLYNEDDEQIQSKSTYVYRLTDDDSTSCTFNNLSPGTYYRIVCVCKRSSDNEGNDIPSSSQEELASWSSSDYTDKKPAPDLWSWYSSNGSASASQTQTAHTAVTNKGELSDFSYLVWNDMCEKVLEVREWQGYSWSTRYASYNNTRMTSSDKVLTAVRFNSLRQNIGSLSSTGLPVVSAGDSVVGSYFTTLMSVVNDYIKYSQQ